MKRIMYLVFFIVISNISYSQNPCPGIATVTYDGKTYNTVLIGTQCWLKENLNVGTRISGSQNPSNNVTIEKYCYNNLESNCDTYGGLYQWNEAMAYSTIPGTQGICPSGWHIPTYAEFQTLGAPLITNGNALKAIGQGTGGGAGTNTSGFSLLIAGYRPSDGNFYNLGNYTYYWSSTEYSTNNPYSMYLDLNTTSITFDYGKKDYGYSVRCIKDGTVDVEKQSNIPNNFNLYQNYPNPFNPTTKINFSLPLATKVTIRIYDMLGREIKTLVNAQHSAGSHQIEWRGDDNNGQKVATGIYMYALSTDKMLITKKMILMK